MTLTIYCDSRSDELLAESWGLLNGPLAGAIIKRLPPLRESPDFLRPLLEWERLDWVIASDDEVLCAVEFSGHGYTGDNSFQRFARIYRAATLGIPSIYFTPFNRARLNELDQGRSSPRNVSPELFQTMIGMSDSLDVPCLAVNWPTSAVGTPAPLQTTLVAPQARHVVRLVHYFAEGRAQVGANRSLPVEFTDVLEHMNTQAMIPLRGSETRGKLGLPISIESAEWIFDALPASYFSYGKVDKVLAAASLLLVDDRSILGQPDPFWSRTGDSFFLYLGYQWRPDPASGLIALAAGQAAAADLPLIVVWPRVFHSASAERNELMRSLIEFKQSGTGHIARAGKELGIAQSSLATFRERVSIAENQFGIYTAHSKPGRILNAVAQVVVFGDAVLAP